MNLKQYNTEISNYNDDLSFLKNKTLLISGGSGLIGKYMIDVIMYHNIHKELNCKILTLSRDKNKAKNIFKEHINTPYFKIIKQDINLPLDIKLDENKIEYFIHLASNTHPILYSTQPIDTIKSNVLGTINILDFALKHHVERFLFASSIEIYGKCTNEKIKFTEDYCGYIDPNTLRAGYPESKRCAEALCQAYIKEKGVNIVIGRLSRIYGPTVRLDDSKSINQFLMKGIKKENIVLKSKGTQMYSFCYVKDAVSGLLFVLKNGIKGEAYNIGDEESETYLLELAKVIANYSNTKIEHDLPSNTEKEGYSTADYALMSCEKINKLGWRAKIHLKEGIERTLSILKEN